MSVDINTCINHNVDYPTDYILVQMRIVFWRNVFIRKQITPTYVIFDPWNLP